MGVVNLKEEIEQINLDDSFLDKPDPRGFWKWKEKRKIERINLYHKVTHIIAFLILIPYIFLVTFNRIVPDSYSTIVSVVIGFYFAKSLLEKG